MTAPDCRLAWQAMRDVVSERQAGSPGVTRVAVQWAHCSQAVGAGDVHGRLTQLFRGRDDVVVVAAGCDGACFAATQVVAELPDGTARFFDRVAGDGDLSEITAVVDGGARERARPVAELEVFFSAQHVALMEGIGSVDPASLDEYVASSGYLAWPMPCPWAPMQLYTWSWTPVSWVAAALIFRRPENGRQRAA